MSFIDSNLPTFHLLPSRTSPTSETTICQSQNDSNPTQKYLKRRDPRLTDNYSISLHDAFYPDITYASISAPAIYPSQARKNSSPAISNSLPDPPRVPAQIAVNLYNPDSKVMLTQKPSSWGSGPYWEFSLPKTSFLQPTGSKLDHSLDATKKLLAALPVATFRWRKEGGVLSRSSLRCSLVHPDNVPLDDGGAAPSSDPNGKRKAAGSGSSEPDIQVALFKDGLNGGKQAGKGEITIFETNLKRVEVEDVKGLEVTLIMTAIAIADMYFGDMRTNFNLGSRAPANFSGPGRAASFGLQQQMDLATRADNTQQAGSQDSSSNSAAPPPYMGGPPPGFTGDTKVRPTQEQLFNPTFQQQLRDEEQRRQEAAARAERERWEAAARAERERREAAARAEQERREAAARAERERREAARLAEQEAEARRLQEEFEAEAAREAARIDAETRRLRAQYEHEAAEMEARQRRSFWGSGNSRPQTQPGANGRRVGGHQHINRPPSLTQMAPWEGHGHTSSMGEANGAPPRPPRPQNNLSPGNSSGPKLQPKKSGWFGGGKTLDSSKDRRKSFMGLRMFGESGGGDNSPPPPKQKTKEKGKAKGKLEKKKSGMW